MMSGDSSDLPVNHRFLSERRWLNFALVGGLLAFTVVSGAAIWLLPFNKLRES